MSQSITSVNWTLPVNPTSPSALVSATHLVLFRLEALDVRQSTVAPDGTLARDIVARVSAEALYKGTLTDPVRTSVELSLHQEKLDRFGEQPPPAFNPGVLAPGTSYLLDAVAPGETQLSGLFNASALRAIRPAATALDAHLAQEWEQRFLTASPTKPELIELLLATTRTHRTELHALFAEYLWLRVSPKLWDMPGLLPQVLELALDPQSGEGLALALLAELDTLALDLDRESLDRLVCAYLAAISKLLSPKVAYFVGTQSLYNIVFGDRAAPRSEVPDCGLQPEAMARARASLFAIEGDRTQALARWLR